MLAYVKNCKFHLVKIIGYFFWRIQFLKKGACVSSIVQKTMDLIFFPLVFSEDSFKHLFRQWWEVKLLVKCFL